MKWMECVSMGVKSIYLNAFTLKSMAKRGGPRLGQHRFNENYITLAVCYGPVCICMPRFEECMPCLINILTAKKERERESGKKLKWIQVKTFLIKWHRVFFFSSFFHFFSLFISRCRCWKKGQQNSHGPLGQ